MCRTKFYNIFQERQYHGAKQLHNFRNFRGLFINDGNYRKVVEMKDYRLFARVEAKTLREERLGKVQVGACIS